MRKLKILTIAFLCALIVPVFAGCFGGGDPKLELHSSPAVYYAVGDQINLDNAKIKYGESYVTITNSMISNFSTTTAGEKEMIISYEGKTIIVEYTVFKNVLNDAWYKAENDEMYTYVKFNIQNKIMTAFVSDFANINDIDFNDVTTHSYEYSQNISSDGVEFSIVSTDDPDGIVENISIFDITTNSFIFDSIAYDKYGSTMIDGTMTLNFTKCR